MRKRANSGIRILVCYVMMLVLMFVSVMRLFIINGQGYEQTRLISNGYSIKISTLRGTVFDCNMRPITNAKKKIIAAVLPTPRAITAISSVVDGDKLEAVLSTLKQGKPAIVEVDEYIQCSGIECIEVYEHVSSDTPAPQLIGYADATGHGVCGIEGAFDEELYSDLAVSAVFSTDGLGNFLEGESVSFTNDTTVVSSGVALTIDSDIQRAVLSAMEGIQCGAAVVTEIGTGKIRAMVSVPEYDLTQISAYLDDENSPMLNRALAAYNVGSAFKPCVAAATLESGENLSFNTECTGSTEIDGHVFNCHKAEGHGRVDIKGALSQSCNTFFYQLSVLTGADAIYNMASSLCYGRSLDIGRLRTDSGNITSISVLRSSNKALANLAIGQGELLLSPVSILTLYEAIANKGIYYSPTIVEGTVANGMLTPNEKTAPTRVMSADTAEKLRKYLIDVVENGTGLQAKPSKCTAAGKTATAETGWKKDGRLIQNSWFCGFFPAHQPKYAVAVVVEDSRDNQSTGAPVFKRIADKLSVYLS